MPIIYEINMHTLENSMIETNWVIQQVLDFKQEHSKKTQLPQPIVNKCVLIKEVASRMLSHKWEIKDSTMKQHWQYYWVNFSHYRNKSKVILLSLEKWIFDMRSHVHYWTIIFLSHIIIKTISRQLTVIEHWIFN